MNNLFEDFHSNGNTVLASWIGPNNDKCTYYQRGKNRIYIEHFIAGFYILKCFEFFFDLNTSSFMNIYTKGSDYVEKRFLYGNSK